MTEQNERSALSSNHFSVDDQINDVVTYLRTSSDPELRDRYADLIAEFPEYENLTWSGSWVDTEASRVDAEYMNWVSDWIENNTPVYWEEGEPWIGGNKEAAEITVTVTRSAGTDGAVVVFIDTTFEPDASDDGPGLRVLINDSEAYVGKPHVLDQSEREAESRTLTVPVEDLKYTEEATDGS